MIPCIDIRRDKRSRLRVRSGNNQILNTHNIELKSNRDQAVDMLLDWNKDLSSHMSTLLRSGCLVFDMNTSRSLLDEHLRELHDSRQPAMPRICIGNYRAQVIHIRRLGKFFFCHPRTSFALLSIMEELCHEQMLDLIGHG